MIPPDITSAGSVQRITRLSSERCCCHQTTSSRTTRRRRQRHCHDDDIRNRRASTRIRANRKSASDSHSSPLSLSLALPEVTSFGRDVDGMKGRLRRHTSERQEEQDDDRSTPSTGIGMTLNPLRTTNFVGNVDGVSVCHHATASNSPECATNRSRFNSPGVTTDNSYSLPTDPRRWTRDDVSAWLGLFDADDIIDRARFSMNGKALCLMTVDMFEYRVPRGGATLHADFRRRLREAIDGAPSGSGELQCRR